jgi:hypothetical protein
MNRPHPVVAFMAVTRHPAPLPAAESTAKLATWQSTTTVTTQAAPANVTVALNVTLNSSGAPGPLRVARTSRGEDDQQILRDPIQRVPRRMPSSTAATAAT